MTGAQSLEHRQGTPRHGTGGQSPCVWHGGRQQADTGHDQQFAILAGCKGKAEHSAKVFDADHFGSKNVRHTDRIDKFGTHDISPSRHAKRELSASGENRSRPLLSVSGAMVNQTFHEGSMNRDKEQAFVFIGGFALIVGLILAKLAGWA